MLKKCPKNVKKENKQQEIIIRRVIEDTLKQEKFKLLKIKINRTIVLLNKYKKTVGGKQMTKLKIKGEKGIKKW